MTISSNTNSRNSHNSRRHNSHTFNTISRRNLEPDLPTNQ
jgi:hypothetical protein